MVKNELKIELSQTEELKQLIQKAYFDNGNMGKITNSNFYLELTDDVNLVIFSGLNGISVKITNEIIDGSMRFIVEEGTSIKLFPISTYCIITDDKYSFY